MGVYGPAVDQAVNTESGQAVQIALWDQAAVKEGQSHGHVITSQPQHGTLVFEEVERTEGDGESPNVTYTPTAGFVGSESFKFHLLSYPHQFSTNIANKTKKKKKKKNPKPKKKKKKKKKS